MALPEKKPLPAKSILQLELLWVLITALVVVLVLLPVFRSAATFPFYFLNIVYIVALINCTRYIFLLPLTPIAKKETWKIILVFLCLPAIFFMVQELNLFQAFLDERGIEALVGEQLPFDRRNALGRYIHNEIMLFGVGSIISTVILPFRLLISVWRGRNKEGV